MRRALFVLPLALAPIALGQQTPVSKTEAAFLAVPDAKLAGEHLRILTRAPHPASSPEDYADAQYVAKKFREAGLETEIVPYRVVLTFPEVVKFEASAPGGFHSDGPHREHVEIPADLPQDPGQNDPRVLPPFNSSSASGDVTAEVVYANYGTPKDFEHLADLGIDLRGKLILVRYGGNFRGVKAFLAQRSGAAGVIIYSDPADDGAQQGKVYPEGPWRPETGVQRGSIGYIFEYPGDPETPGIASTPNLPMSKRISLDKAASEPRVLAVPISAADAAPLMAHLAGPLAPREWQGGLGGEYRIGPGPVRVHLTIKLSYDLHTIWDVIGRVRGEDNSQWIVAGNHRDAWVYGASDPNSGTAAMLETVHGIGALLKKGWHPKRTLIFGSWDAEEQGLIGSTEWVEQNADALSSHAVAYLNTDVAVDGPNFNASAVPSLRGFLLNVAHATPAAAGGSVYDAWLAARTYRGRPRISGEKTETDAPATIRVGNLGSGSDFTPFFQHLGIPSTDFGSGGPSGVYHSVFDDYVWFTRFADPGFHLLQQQARFLGMEMLRMSESPNLPLDEVAYATDIQHYLDEAESRSQALKLNVDFSEAKASAAAFLAATKSAPAGDGRAQLRAELALASPQGLKDRPWYRNTIFAPGETTGYAAVTLPGLADALDNKDGAAAQQALAQVAECLRRAAREVAEK